MKLPFPVTEKASISSLIVSLTLLNLHGGRVYMYIDIVSQQRLVLSLCTVSIVMFFNSRFFTLSWLQGRSQRPFESKSTSNAFFIIDESLVEEEEGYLPSDLDIDDFLSQSNPRQRSPSRWHSFSVLLSWTLCIVLGSLLGAYFYNLYTYIPSEFSSEIISSTFAPGVQDNQYQSLPPTLQGFILNKTSWNYTHPPPSPCGNNSSSARAAGCRFGPMSFAWYPLACYDFELEVEFLAADDWKWYSEPDYQVGGEESSLDTMLVPWRELPRHEVLKGMYDKVFVSSSYHLTQCEFIQRKLGRAVMAEINGDGEQILLDNYITRSWHEKSCAGRHGEKQETPEMEIVKYLDCVQL